MINVVFLLLVFFMMTSQIASAPPFRLSPPTAVGGEGADGGLVLYVSAAGEMAFGAARGEAALAAIAALEPGARLTVTADGALAAPELAQLLQRMPEGVALTLTVRQ
ncbi:biopolymer transporter ExbD [uncultured Aliiroseovarius sp.]|nr:biopolymer transporter ExbD [uncultured Aliiroseovarius sp.]